MASRFILPSQQPVQSDGVPYAGGQLFFYLTGTSTPTPTYQDQNLTTPNSNPVILDASGNIGNIWLNPSVVYKVVLEDSNGDLIWTYDPVYPLAPSTIVGIVQGAVSTGSANAQIVSAPGYTPSGNNAFSFIAGFANTGAMNLEANSSGFYPVYQPSSTGPTALVGGEIEVGNIYVAIFNAQLNGNAGGYQIISAASLLALGVSAAMATVLGKTTVAAAAGAMGLAFGQCYFKYVSSASAALVPQGGSYITIAGVDYAIPAAGVSANPASCFINGVSGQSLTANTLYYVYAFNNGGMLALDFSTTGHSTDTTAGNVGVEIKTGDNSRSLVGMVYPQAGPTFADSGANRLVLSWFNRMGKSAIANFTAGRSTTSATYVELNTEIRCQVITWANEGVILSTGGYVSGTGSNTALYTSIGVDGTTPQDAMTQANSAVSSVGGGAACSLETSLLAEGFHYATMLGLVSGGTGTWAGGASTGNRCTMNAQVRG